MPDEHKKEMVNLIQKHNIPLIEDDIYGDVYFGLNRPKTCKTFDESGLVLWCNSISKTLAPGYRVGWIAPGKFKDQFLKLKKYHSISSPTLTQEVIGSFLETGRYQHHLRKLRSTLQANSINFLNAIYENFPEGVKVNRPEGGFVLWIELDKQLSTVDLYERAIKRNISIATGSMFTLQKQFSNCMRLSYGMKWDTTVAQSLKTLGMISKELMGR
ncbi:MAG: GntR family transcriptional regulator [Sphingobacteriales bacterium]|nr:GntR family transcriptional regulator [Sphingobacteriales bacterium]